MKRTLTAFLSFLIAVPAFATESGTSATKSANVPQQIIVDPVTLKPVSQQQETQISSQENNAPKRIGLEYDMGPAPTFQQDYTNGAQQNDKTLTFELEPKLQVGTPSAQINLGEYKIDLNNNTNNTKTANRDAEPTVVSNYDTKKSPEKQNDKTDDKKSSEFANNALSGASMAATGIGGMMGASAWAEQNVDDAADAQMRQYVATFKCDYGSGQIAYAGDTNVEVSGGNELIQLYTQYATLANDLKLRKTSLGMRPGIESEVIIDKSTTGLYDDVNTGAAGGGYASIARAIINPDGEDAEKLNRDRDESGNKLETGKTVAGVGAIAPIFLKQ